MGRVCYQQGSLYSFQISVNASFSNQLEGMARYAGHFLASAEGFGLQLRVFLPFIVSKCIVVLLFRIILQNGAFVLEKEYHQLGYLVKFSHSIYYTILYLKLFHDQTRSIPNCIWMVESRASNCQTTLILVWWLNF